MNKRTGSLVPKPSGFFARVWEPQPNGPDKRTFVNLNTKDRATAKRRLARLVEDIANGERVEVAAAKTTVAETYRAYSLSLHERRVAKGIAMARDEQNNRVRFIYPIIGNMPLGNVTDDHVRQVLDGAQERHLSLETVDKIRGVMSRDFDSARVEKIIAVNPVQDVKLPAGLKKDKRPREILSDAEIEKFLGAPKCDLEIKMLSLVARTEGGMRTAELVRWDWTMLDTVRFAECRILRAKTGDVQRLGVPEMLRPFLRVWWERAGKPTAGPVFPVRRGKRTGQARTGRGVSFASRLRRELFKAGVVRLPPIIDPKTKRAAPNPADSIYSDTVVSRRVDFHSFRRAYNTALAGADVTMQQAMVLSSHSDHKTHMRYVMAAQAARPVPAAALPHLDPALAGSLVALPVPVPPSNDVRNGAQVVDFLGERDTRFELVTFGLGSRRSTN